MKIGQIEYEFARDDYNECLELFSMDLHEKLAPDILSRVLIMYRVPYGNRTNFEEALVSCLYESKLFSKIF